MPWLYNTHTGDVEHQNEAEWLLDEPEASLVGLVNLNIPDSDTTAQAVAAAQAYVKAHGGTTPTTSTAQANANANSTVESGITNAIPGLAQLGDFFSALSQKNTWIRVGKVLIGATLIIVGLSHMTGASNAVSTVARKAPLPI
jgi:hypothetical protein